MQLYYALGDIHSTLQHLSSKELLAVWRIPIATNNARRGRASQGDQHEQRIARRFRRNSIILGKVMNHSFFTRLVTTVAIASPLCVTGVVHAHTTNSKTQVGPNEQTAETGKHTKDNKKKLLLE